MTESLALTADQKKLVPLNDKRARYLFAKEGDEIPDALAEHYGLKQKKKPEDKSREKPEDKSVSQPETK